MTNIVEEVISMVLSAIIVFFLIVILFAGKMNQGEGVFGALANNGYKEVSDSVDQSITVEGQDVTRYDMSLNRKDFTVSYIGGIQKTSSPRADATGGLEWTNVKSLKSLIIIKFENKLYKYNPSDDSWLVSLDNGASYTAQSDVYAKDFDVKLIEVKNVKGQQAIFEIGDISAVESPELINIMYDQERDLLIGTTKGTYRLELKLTEIISGYESRKIVAIPFNSDI